VSGSVLVTLSVLAALLLVTDPFSGASTPPPREIVLEARDLAFGASNPTLEARPGERLRLVVRNTDPGILHSVSLPGLATGIHHIPWGEEVVLDVTMLEAGTFEYVCPQHAPKMKGKIVIRP
jgi:plastocyanin